MWSDLNHLIVLPAIAVILALVLIALGARRGVRSCGPRKAVTALAPSILLIAAVFFTIPNPRHSSEGAETVAMAICLGFGFAMAIENFTLLSWPYRLNGSLLALLHGSLILLLASMFLGAGSGRRSWLAFAGPPVFWLAAIPYLIGMNRKAKRRLIDHFREAEGLCLSCGYNLTGNLSGVCPECGEKIKQPIPEMNLQDNPWSSGKEQT